MRRGNPDGRVKAEVQVALKQSHELCERIIFSYPHHSSRQCFPEHVWLGHEIHQSAGAGPFPPSSSPVAGSFHSLYAKNCFLASKHIARNTTLVHLTRAKTGYIFQNSLILRLASTYANKPLHFTTLPRFYPSGAVGRHFHHCSPCNIFFRRSAKDDR